jgi:hypothetical protein
MKLARRKKWYYLTEKGREMYAIQYACVLPASVAVKVSVKYALQSDEM